MMSSHRKPSPAATSKDGPSQGMSCQMSDSCESDLEPVTRMKDVGRPKPTKRPARRHVVNPNFMFFCQIVLLVIPISVLFAGLYFMNISSPVVVLTCGAIIFAVLCIFLFVRPFKVEKCEEKKPLRRSYEYSQIKQAIDVKTELPKSKLKKSDKRQSIYHGLSDIDGVAEVDEECPPQVKNESTGTLLSFTSSLPDVASQARISAAVCPKSSVASADGRCRCCLMGCRGPITREKEVGFQEKLRPPKSMQDSDGSALETKGCAIQVEQFSPPTSLGVIEEEDCNMTPLGSPGPCSERNCSAKLLIPDEALSDTSNSSSPTSNRTRNFSNALYSDNTCHLSKSSRAMPVYSSALASSATTWPKTGPSPESPTKTTSTRRTEQKITKSFTRDQLKHGRGQSNALTPNNRLGPLELRNHTYMNASHPSPSIPITFSSVLNTQRETPETVCTDEVCSFEAKNQLEPQVGTKKPSSALLPNNNFKGPLETPEKPMTSKRRGYLDQNNHELTAHGKQDIFMDSKQGHLEKRTIVPEFQAVKFQLCPSEATIKNDPCSSSSRNRNKQPILIKLFPTSSKDGVFSWEANPVKPKEIENASTISTPSTFPGPPHPRTADEYVQTTAPEMVDTQTSAVFPAKGRSVPYMVPEVKDSNATQVNVAHQRTPGKAAHQASSGSIVDFVLRPFSKVVNPFAKTAGDKNSQKDIIMNSNIRSKCGKAVWQKPQEMNETNSSKFDLLKIQSSSKKRSHGITMKEVEEITTADIVNKVEKSPQKDVNAKVDICSIYYSSIHGKLYQPTKSGLLVTESSKEEVDKPQRAVALPKMVNAGTDNVLENSGTYLYHQKLLAGQGTKQDRAETGRRLSQTKRKSGIERKTKTKCAKHDEPDPKYSKNLFYNNPFLPRGKGTEDIEIAQTQVNSELKGKLTFMCPPFNLDISSGPCDEEASSDLKFSQEPEKSICKKQPRDCRDSKKSRSPDLHRGLKSKNHRISHQVETKLFRKSSSSYENVVIEKVIKQKRRTLKKFK